jgi:hypothetical protein
MSSTGCADSNPLFETIRLKVADGLTALASGGQSAVTLDNTSSFHRVTTVASGNDSKTLPKAKSGLVVIVANAAAANSLNVFPALGDAINALSANSAFAVAANKVCLFICASDGQWHCLTTA